MIHVYDIKWRIMSELNDAVEVAKSDPASGWRLGNANRLMMEC